MSNTNPNNTALLYPDRNILSIRAIAKQIGVSATVLRRYFEKTWDINEAVERAKRSATR